LFGDVVFGDVAGFVDGSGRPHALVHIGIYENSRQRLLAYSVSSRRSSNSAFATSIDSNGPPRATAKSGHEAQLSHPKLSTIEAN
jgi:hypothetical protein